MTKDEEEAMYWSDQLTKKLKQKDFFTAKRYLRYTQQHLNKILEE